VGHAYDGHGDGRGLGVGFDVGDEGAVDLQSGNGEPLDISEAGIAGTEIVDRQMDA